MYKITKKKRINQLNEQLRNTCERTTFKCWGWLGGLSLGSDIACILAQINVVLSSPEIKSQGQEIGINYN